MYALIIIKRAHERNSKRRKIFWQSITQTVKMGASGAQRV